MTNKGTVGDKHSGGLTCEAFGNKQTHCKLLRDNLVTSCKLLRDIGNKQAHCMHIVRSTLVTRRPLDSKTYVNKQNMIWSKFRTYLDELG